MAAPARCAGLSIDGRLVHAAAAVVPGRGPDDPSPGAVPPVSVAVHGWHLESLPWLSVPERSRLPGGVRRQEPAGCRASAVELREMLDGRRRPVVAPPCQRAGFR